MKTFFIMCVLVATILCLAAAASAGDIPDGRLHVFVSILPQAYFVECIGGEHVVVSVLVGPGQSPATYEPTPHQMAKLSGTAAYFRIGVPFETRLLEKASRLIDHFHIVDTQQGIPKRQMEAHDHDKDESSQHGAEAGMPDPHIWLDPQLVKIQMRIIAEELMRLDSTHAVDYGENLRQFEAELDTLDATIAAILSGVAGRSLLVFHPSFGYFTDRYGLQQVVIEAQGKEPGARQLGHLIHYAKANNVRAIIVQQQFSKKTALAIAHEIGGDVVTLDPLARDYMTNMEEMARRLRQALERQEL